MGTHQTAHSYLLNQLTQLIGAYSSFSSNETQSLNDQADDVVAINFQVSALEDGCTNHTDSIEVINAGTYECVATLQVNTTANDAIVFYWFQISTDGGSTYSNLANSCGRVYTYTNDSTIVTKTALISMVANQRIRIVFQSTNEDVQLLFVSAANGRPAIAGAVLTIKHLT